MIALIRKRTAKKIVQRLRLRSTIEPPPRGPVPLPTPNAPERPESFPECSSTRKMTITAMTTCEIEKSVSTRSGYRVALSDGPQTPRFARTIGHFRGPRLARKARVVAVLDMPNAHAAGRQ